MKKTLLTLLSTIVFSFTLSAQNINIPDGQFKYLLLNDNTINTDADKLEISVEEAEAFNGFINVKSSNITSLAGIEAFVHVTQLDCSKNNQLTSLDVTKNIALLRLNCSNNELTTLDVSENSELEDLDCSYNRLKTFNLGNKNSKIKKIKVNNNFLGYANQRVSQANAVSAIVGLENITTLTDFDCSNNQITNLNLSTNPNLANLNVSNNLLTSLDLSKNPLLTSFDCRVNPSLQNVYIIENQSTTEWVFENSTILEIIYITDIENSNKAYSNKAILGTYNIQGQTVCTTYQGLVIIRYTDGTSEKVMQ